MEFESAAKAAARLGVTVRAVQKWAKSGKLPGAKQIGRSWLIPADALVSDPPHATEAVQSEIMLIEASVQHSCDLFPLLNTSFAPGHAYDAVLTIGDEDERAIARGEYYYFTGQVELASKEAELYLEHSDAGLALSANLMHAFSNLSMGKLAQVRDGIARIHGRTAALLATETDPLCRANAILLRTAADVLLRVPNANTVELARVISVLPKGSQLFGCYVLSYAAYQRDEYDYSRGVIDLALALGGDDYPLAANYLRTMLCIDFMCQRRTEEAKQCFQKLWSLVEPDGGFEVLGEHHLLMMGLPEICLKRQNPERYKELIAITKRFGISWQKSRPDQLQANGLTLMEHTIASLYSRGWAVKEIALHMDISERMIKHHIAMIYEKLCIGNRTELTKYMLG
ncbi:MAG: helix-turn-helix domain-containing protein [Clostridia bacterium]|nr:helix-turn-helix domain-containing protein [Clostridia bacterium]